MLEYTKYNTNAAREFIASIYKKINRLTPAKTKEFLEEIKQIEDEHIQEAAKDILYYSKLENIDPAILFIIEQKYLLHDKILRPKTEEIQKKYNSDLKDESLALNFEDIPELEREGLDQILNLSNKNFTHIKYVFETLQELTPKSVANFIIDLTVGLPNKFKDACKKFSSKSDKIFTKNITINIGQDRIIDIGEEKKIPKPTKEAKLIYRLNANDKFGSVYLPFFFGKYGIKEITDNSIKQYKILKRKGECSIEKPFLMFVGAKKIANQKYSTSERLKAIRLEDLTNKYQSDETRKVKGKTGPVTDKKEKANIFLFEFADTGEGFTSNQLEKLYDRIYETIKVDATDETKSFKKTLTRGSATEKLGEIGLGFSAKTFAQTFGGTFELNSNYRYINGKLYKDSILFDCNKSEFKPNQKASPRDYDIQDAMQKRAKTYISIQLREHTLRNLDKIIIEKQKYADAERPLSCEEEDFSESSMLETVEFDEFIFPEEM